MTRELNRKFSLPHKQKLFLPLGFRNKKPGDFSCILFMYVDSYSLNGINNFHPFQLKQCQKIIKFLLTANLELESEGRKKFNDLF